MIGFQRIPEEHDSSPQLALRVDNQDGFSSSSHVRHSLIEELGAAGKLVVGLAEVPGDKFEQVLAGTQVADVFVDAVGNAVNQIDEGYVLGDSVTFNRALDLNSQDTVAEHVVRTALWSLWR
jgi:hypothetical protein